MKTKEEIVERISSESLSLSKLKQSGHMESLTRGWIEALEWVLEKEHSEK
jgi:hypothetical protein